MCVILYAPPKKTIRERFLRNAYANNPDGAGVMYYDWRGNVLYRKGFMDFNQLKEFWNNIDDRLPRALHCRIATSGQIIKENCHPFPITNQLEKMRWVHGSSADGCLMHNGVLPDYAPKEGIKSAYSDTMVFNKEVIYPLCYERCIENEGVKKLMNGLDSSFLLFLPSKKVLMFGDWILDKDGFYASNYSYSNNWYLEGCNGYDFENIAIDFNEDYIKSIRPRYHYVIEFKDDGPQFPYFKLDDFEEDTMDFIINLDQPVATCYMEDDGVYRFEVDTYDTISAFLPKGYEIVSCLYYDKDGKII